MDTIKATLFMLQTVIGAVLTPTAHAPEHTTNGAAAVQAYCTPLECTIVRSNGGTVRGRNPWDRLNLSPNGVEPSPVHKGKL